MPTEKYKQNFSNIFPSKEDKYQAAKLLKNDMKENYLNGIGLVLSDCARKKAETLLKSRITDDDITKLIAIVVEDCGKHKK